MKFLFLEKYVYVTGEKKKGLKLQRTFDKKIVLSYHFEYDNLKRKNTTTLYGENDSIVLERTLQI